MDIFTGLGLAAPAGLNAYIPLLTLGLVARFTDLIELEAPYDFIASDAGLIILTVLLLIELFADAVPGLDTLNDIIQTAIRPATGAVLMLATGEESTGTTAIALAILGALVAGTVHAVKALGRPVVTATTAGVGNPVVSSIENVFALLLSVLAILIPVLVVIVSAVALLAFSRWLFQRRRKAKLPEQ